MAGTLRQALVTCWGHWRGEALALVTRREATAHLRGGCMGDRAWTIATVAAGRSVVVTGMGVLTSLGQGQADNWRALTAGVSGIRRISRFPIGGLQHHHRRHRRFRAGRRTVGPGAVRTRSPSW